MIWSYLSNIGSTNENPASIAKINVKLEEFMKEMEAIAVQDTVQ